MFLNGMLMLEPALTVKGPWGLGSRQCPYVEGDGVVTANWRGYGEGSLGVAQVGGFKGHIHSSFCATAANVYIRTRHASLLRLVTIIDYT